MLLSDEYGVPEIYEYEATGRLKDIYTDIQYVLKVPIVNFMFRTLALYPEFLDMAWQQVRDNMLLKGIEQAAEVLRNPNLDVSTSSFQCHMHDSPEVCEQLRRIVFTFNYVNPKLLLIASALSESLGSRPVGNGKQKVEWITPGILPGLKKFPLMPVESAPSNIQALLTLIQQTHRTYDLASDYRALAYYPEFLADSWRDLSSFVKSDQYSLLSSKLQTKAVHMVHDKMVFPVTIDREQLQNYYTDRDIAGIMGTVQMFQAFLPPLIINGEYLRRRLD